MMTRDELLIEIADFTAAINAFRIGCPWLAPAGLHDAPSIEWLRMQQRSCRKELARMNEVAIALAILRALLRVRHTNPGARFDALRAVGAVRVIRSTI